MAETTEEFLARMEARRAEHAAERAAEQAANRARSRVPGHKIRWFVYAGGYGQPLTKIPHTASMRGHWPGWDAECECGWESRTGGATKASVQRDVRAHKYEVTGDWRHL